jgi:hypothetical protein
MSDSDPNQDEGVRMPSHCPICQTPTDPADFHVKPDVRDSVVWTYECRGCDEEKETQVWCHLAETGRLLS